jgi:hypothetical protein
MRLPIDARLVESRMRDLAQTTVNQTVSLFKGGTFALAAVLLIEILGQPEGRLLRLALWISSFLLALTSYNAYLNTSIVDFRESVANVVIIIMQMMIELMLFAVLAPRYAESLWRFWIFVYAAFLILTAVRMLYFGMNLGLQVDAGLKPMLEAIDMGRRRNAWRMLLISIFALAFGIAGAVLPLQSQWLAGLTIAWAIFTMLQSITGLVGMHRQRMMMEQMLDEALAKEAAS